MALELPGTLSPSKVSSFTDCSQPGTCPALEAGTGKRGWDAYNMGSTR